MLAARHDDNDDDTIQQNLQPPDDFNEKHFPIKHLIQCAIRDFAV